MIESIPYVLTGIGIIISILYYTSVLSNSNKTRQANLFNSIYDSMLNKELFEIQWELHTGYQYADYDDFLEKYGQDKDSVAFKNLHYYFAHLEGMGIYVKHGLISPTLIDDFMSSDIVLLWEKFEPFFNGARIATNNPTLFEYVEYLYNQIKPIREKQLTELAS